MISNRRTFYIRMKENLEQYGGKTDADLVWSFVGEDYTGEVEFSGLARLGLHQRRCIAE